VVVGELHQLGRAQPVAPPAVGLRVGRRFGWEARRARLRWAGVPRVRAGDAAVGLVPEIGIDANPIDRIAKLAARTVVVALADEDELIEIDRAAGGESEEDGRRAADHRSSSIRWRSTTRFLPSARSSRRPTSDIASALRPASAIARAQSTTPAGSSGASFKI